jgi:hypothetical protein
VDVGAKQSYGDYRKSTRDGKEATTNSFDGADGKIYVTILV